MPAMLILQRGDMNKMLMTVLIAWFILPAAFGQAAPGFMKISNVSTLSFSDTGCADSTTCYYQVTALDTFGHESPPAACSTTTACFQGNQAFGTIPATGTHTVVLTWAASSTAGATYNIYRAVGPAPPSGLGALVN